MSVLPEEQYWKMSEAASEAAAKTCHAAEDGVVRGYKAIEDGVVRGCKTVENAVRLRGPVPHPCGRDRPGGQGAAEGVCHSQRIKSIIFCERPGLSRAVRFIPRGCFLQPPQGYLYSTTPFRSPLSLTSGPG